MIIPKSCPKCGGDMEYEKYDSHFNEINEFVCIQCGKRVPADIKVPVRR